MLEKRLVDFGSGRLLDSISGGGTGERRAEGFVDLVCTVFEHQTQRLNISARLSSRQISTKLSEFWRLGLSLSLSLSLPTSKAKCSDGSCAEIV